MRQTSIDVPPGDPCAFCDYLSGARPYTVLFRGDLASVLVTREQRGVGHVLVIPNRHCPTLLEASEPELHALIELVASVSSLIDEAFERPGIAIWQNNGLSAHQAIPHLHFHVAGTLPGGGTDFAEVPELTLEGTDAIAAKLDAKGSLAHSQR